MKTRDKALEKVTRLNWQNEALKKLNRVCQGDLLAEDIRENLRSSGFPEPHHPNAWGALIMAACKREMLVKTGKYRASRAPRSHGRYQPEWRVTDR
jgi:hypothetical protein